MPNAPGPKGNKPSKQLAAIDQLLIAALKQGPAKKREAINRILELVPDWTRGDCWQRIRELRETIQPAARLERAPDKAKRSARPAPIPPAYGAPWTPEADDTLFRLAGYEPVRRIAQRLGRTVGAGALPSWCTRNERQGHRRMVVARTAEASASQSGTAEVPHRKRDSEGTGSTYNARLIGGILR